MRRSKRPGRSRDGSIRSRRLVATRTMSPGSDWTSAPRPVVVLQGAPGGAFEVLELAAVERPQEGSEPEQAQQKCAGDQPCERGHRASVLIAKFVAPCG